MLRIEYKLGVLSIICLFTCSLIVYGLTLRENEHLFSERMAEELSALSQNMADDLLLAMSETGDEFSVATTLLKFERYPSISAAVLYDPQGQIIHQYLNPDRHWANKLAKLQAINLNQISRQPQVTALGLMVKKPIGEETFVRGYLVVTESLNTHLSAARWHALTHASPWVLLTIFIFMMVGFWLIRKLIKPMLMLAHFTRHVDQTNNYALRCVIEGHDEVTQLAVGINNMLTTIDSEMKRNAVQNQQLLAQQEEIKRMANMDVLTGLVNRFSFMDTLKRELASVERNGLDLAVLFIDLDGFKEVNDTLGHGVGDALLKKVGGFLTKAIRTSDLCCRYGGDEFLILVNRLEDPVIAISIAERIVEQMQFPLDINGLQIKTSASIGVAFAKNADYAAEPLIANSDVAMYVSKNKGKGIYTIYQTTMQDLDRRRLLIAAQLNLAIEHNQFEVYYQCKIGQQGNVVGFEALIRWVSPELGRVAPSEFIPIAEQGGKIRAITRWVLRKAIQDLPFLQSLTDPSIVVSVNISSIDLQDAYFMEYIQYLVGISNIQYQNLQFEITEHSYLESFESANRFFEQIKAKGGTIALDDFGTGYSSLSYLSKIAIDVLKIDRAFVSQIEANPKNNIVLMSILSLAQKLGLHTCAEGVENLEQVQHLFQSGCDSIQGYYFAKPVVKENLAQVIQVAKQQFDKQRSQQDIANNNG